MIRLAQDGSLMRNGVKVGHMVNSGRPVPQFVGIDQHYVGEIVCHGWAINDLDGNELYWSGHWGEAFKIGCMKLHEKAQVSA